MKNLTKLKIMLLIIAFVLVGAFALTACENGNGPSDNNQTPVVTNVSVSPQTHTLTIPYGTSPTMPTVQLIASVTGNHNPATTVVWTVISSGIHASVSADGLVTAISQGTATIRATSTVTTTVYGEATITINQATQTQQIIPTNIPSIPTGLSVAFSQGQTLEQLTLDLNGWEWENPSEIVGEVRTGAIFDIIYNRGANYVKQTNTITINITQAIPTNIPSIPTGLSVAFSQGQTLGQLTLDLNGWEWENPSEIVGEVRTGAEFDVIYNRGANYQTQTGVITIDVELTVILSFETNGGILIPDMNVIYFMEYGTLPIPIRDGSIFAGWWTENGIVSGDWGTRIFSTTIVENDNNHTLYAKWTIIFPSISAGHSHSMALDADGRVWTWGNGFDGRLGHGNTTDQLSPMMITTLSNVVAISVGSSHSMALDADGRVWTWGNGFDGRLGHGNTTNQLSPMMITTLSLF